MENEGGDLFVGLLMAVLGLIGLILASGAHDNEIYLFGLSLAGFATVFVFGQLKRHFDREDSARARARTGKIHHE